MGIGGVLILAGGVGIWGAFVPRRGQNLSTAEPPNYVSACAPPSKLPQRHFCAVCGFPSAYTCVTCGARYCSSRCLGTHQDTR